jgi:hypothetical protein
MTSMRTRTTNATATTTPSKALSAQATVKTAAAPIPHKEGGHGPKITIARSKIHLGTTGFAAHV